MQALVVTLNLSVSQPFSSAKKVLPLDIAISELRYRKIGYQTWLPCFSCAAEKAIGNSSVVRGFESVLALSSSRHSVSELIKMGF